MSDTPKIALVTCSSLPNLDPEEALLIPVLKQHGVSAQAAVWDDPSVDWASYDLVMIRSAWDYAGRRSEFLQWAASVPRLVNPLPVLRWNTDKHYLRDLEVAELPVVPTIWVEPDEKLGSHRLHTRFPAMGDMVIKPAVSAGSVDTARYSANSARSRGLALRHATKLLNDGRSVMVQRYLQSVDTKGESALIYLNGCFAYAAHKGAMLEGPDIPFDDLYKPEEVSPYEPTDDERSVADQVFEGAMTMIPGLSDEDRPLLYSRVDLVHGDDGQPLLLELEMTEPSLFPTKGAGGLDMVADAIIAHL